MRPSVRYALMIAVGVGLWMYFHPEEVVQPVITFTRPETPVQISRVNYDGTETVIWTRK